MASKQHMKMSEARIIMYLANLNTVYTYKLRIATKLNIDYGYVVRIMQGMKEKGWIKSVRAPHYNKIFYSVNFQDFPDIKEQAHKVLVKVKQNDAK